VFVTNQNFEAMRKAMVASQLRTTAVSDARVVAVMQTVARETFVPAERRALAYIDVSIPVGGGRALSAPMVVGRLLNEAQIETTDHVLVIGSGTGYVAALVCSLAKTVVALESDAALGGEAKAALDGVSNVTCVAGPLNEGWADAAPYDVIIIDGAVELVHDSIVAQLKTGGRLVTGLIDHGVTRLALGRRAGSGFGMTSYADADVPVLPGFAKPKAFVF
jgi:protein-L-isoaspartate(D-aspartate) O-methyltransferase